MLGCGAMRSQLLLDSGEVKQAEEVLGKGAQTRHKAISAYQEHACRKEVVEDTDQSRRLLGSSLLSCYQSILVVVVLLLQFLLLEFLLLFVVSSTLIIVLFCRIHSIKCCVMLSLLLFFLLRFGLFFFEARVHRK